MIHRQELVDKVKAYDPNADEDALQNICQTTIPDHAEKGDEKG